MWRYKVGHYCHLFTRDGDRMSAGPDWVSRKLTQTGSRITADPLPPVLGCCAYIHAGYTFLESELRQYASKSASAQLKHPNLVIEIFTSNFYIIKPTCQNKAKSLQKFSRVPWQVVIFKASPGLVWSGTMAFRHLSCCLYSNRYNSKRRLSDLRQWTVRSPTHIIYCGL